MPVSRVPDHEADCALIARRHRDEDWNGAGFMRQQMGQLSGQREDEWLSHDDDVLRRRRRRRRRGRGVDGASFVWLQASMQRQLIS